MVSNVLDKMPVGHPEPPSKRGAAWVRHSIGMREKINPVRGRCDGAETTSAECQPRFLMMRTE
jgi:hypothetical protein